MVAVQPNWAGKRLGSIIGSCNAELGFTYSQPAGWRLMTEEDVFSSKDVGKGFWMDSSTCFFNGFSEDKIIKSCGDVKERGSYFLSGDLVLEPKVYDSNTACLNIRDTNEVFIDCEDRSITGPVAVRIENLKGFSLSFCRLESSSQVPSIRRILEVVNSENGVLRRSVIGSDYDAYNDVIKSSNITIVNNLFHSSVQQAYSINNIIRQNTFNPTQWGGAAVIISNMGFNNRIESNNIDGKSDGKFENRLGFDDGIGFQDEEKTSIINNVIKNVWDCGIETVGTISQAEISGNVIENAGLCGIGGWYWNSWKENLISDNIVSDSPYMLYIFRSYGLRPEDKFFYFRGNIFSGNKFNNQRASSQSSVIQITKKAGKSSSEGEREIRDEDIIAGNNVFSDNNFGTVTPAPEFTPTEMIVDGGGNICAEVPPYRQPYPLNCDKE